VELGKKYAAERSISYVFVVTCVTRLKLNQEKRTGGLCSPDIYNERAWGAASFVTKIYSLVTSGTALNKSFKYMQSVTFSLSVTWQIKMKLMTLSNHYSMK
jgi:hypothetical protein